jgi:hypothetical protein
MLEYSRRQYLLAAELRRLLLEYGDVCSGPTLEALGMAAGRAMAQAEATSYFDWDTVRPENLPPPPERIPPIG